MGGNFQIHGGDEAAPRSGAALVGGLAFIVFFGCISLVVADTDHFESTTWRYWFGGSTLVLIACVIAYRRPRGPIALAIVLLYALLGGGVLLWITVMFALRIGEDGAPADIFTAIRAYAAVALGLATGWVGWIAFTVTAICHATYREVPRFIRRFQKHGDRWD